MFAQIFASEIESAQSEIDRIQAQIEALKQQKQQYLAWEETAAGAIASLQNILETFPEKARDRFVQAASATLGIENKAKAAIEVFAASIPQISKLEKEKQALASQVAKLEEVVETQKHLLSTKNELINLLEQQEKNKQAQPPAIGFEIVKTLQENANPMETTEHIDIAAAAIAIPPENETVTPELAVAIPKIEKNETVTEEQARADIGMPAPIETDDIVKTPCGKAGRVLYVDANKAIATVKLPTGPANFQVFGLKKISRFQPPVYERVLACTSWSEMRELVLRNPEALVDAIREKPILKKNLPGQIAVYINQVGQAAIADLKALPDAIAADVEALLNSPNLTPSIKPASAIPYTEIQQAARDLYGLKTWEQIRDVLDGYCPATKAEIFRELPKEATNKTKTRFLENLYKLISTYIVETGDRSDLEWLPNTLRNSVLAMPGVAAA